MRLLPLLFVCLGALKAGTPSNWTGNYSPCNQHARLLGRDHIDLGVRLSTANPVLARQFRRAMDFWATIVDLSWHEDDSEDCALQLVDGEKTLFETQAIAARSQLPDRPDFQGWIAFNPRNQLSKIDLYRVSIHEIGHLLGLQHSTSPHSVMYGFELDDQDWLDTTDIAVLSAHHKLRGEQAGQAVRIVKDAIDSFDTRALAHRGWPPQRSTESEAARVKPKK